MNNNTLAFLELVRAGLWDREAHLSQFGGIDFSEISRIAEEQSLVGLITAGLEHVVDVKVPQEILLQFIGSTLQIEEQNKAMNIFLAKLIKKLRDNDVYTLLVKGQGIAQCYEKPLWRASGDIDLYLSKENYEKAKMYLVPLALDVEKEEKKRLHLGMTINGWVVELHGTMHSKLSSRINRVSDEVHNDIFCYGNVRSWETNGVQVFLPSADNDVIIIFNHFINHFFMEGVGLRQICDWCRLLYRYQKEIDVQVLESRIEKAGLKTEWKAFYTLATKYFGLPEVSGFMFQDSSNSKWEKKAERIMEFILETGNFGHNRDNSYRNSQPKMIRKVISLFRAFSDSIKRLFIFPLDSMKVFGKMVVRGVAS